MIVARAHEVDEQTKMLYLKRASIINGSQTQGVLKDFYQSEDLLLLLPAIHVKYELIVTDDEDLIGEISIAFATSRTTWRAFPSPDGAASWTNSNAASKRSFPEQSCKNLRLNFQTTT